MREKWRKKRMRRLKRKRLTQRMNNFFRLEKCFRIQLMINKDGQNCPIDLIKF
ncbi:unnamed protein product [Paramecium sonneborni]|uniref:60S ribosomal protein L41 n=1 Tax=Paramecium sonneborni TaxID=65129 RepID=A0A8S1NJF1_9CILI|nr:unnamed protein product [Paramecium sonneborni]